MARRSHHLHAPISKRVRQSLSFPAQPPSKAGPVADRNIVKDPACELEPGVRLRKPTFRENLPGLQLEAVLDLTAPGHLALCVNNSQTIQIRPFVEHHNVTYVPGPIPPGLGQFVRFPSVGSGADSTQRLESDIKEFLSKYVDQDTQSIAILIAFAFATWFVGCFEVAPVLWLQGPDAEVCLVLRLLNTMCYHAVMLSDLDLSALRSLPHELRVTLLIKEILAPGVERALLNSVRRHFCFARGVQPVDIFGARAMHCDSPSQGIGLRASIDPARRHQPCLTEVDEQRAARFFQERFLAYRMSRYADVQKFESYPDEKFFGFEDEIKAWVGALPSESSVKESIFSAFDERREDRVSARFQDPTCLVVEAALMFCHMDGTKHFFVRELAERVNDLLVGRHADTKLEDRKVGSMLKNLGIHATRVTKGFRVILTPKIRQRIHTLAKAYRVLSIQPTVARCADCKKDQ